MDDYDIFEHKHRFACWAAARAASTSKQRFSVEEGKGLIEAAGIRGWICGDSIERGVDIREFDRLHKNWRSKIVRAAEAKFDLRDVSHGIAAKLINVYLKVWLICALQPDNPSELQSDRSKLTDIIHPPIDRILLEEVVADLKRRSAPEEKELRKLCKPGWSSFSSKDYERIIELLRGVSGDDPFWKVERFWTGHQV